jgi:predicted ATP-grasp superfamily ATP-dependent carboligase
MEVAIMTDQLDLWEKPQTKEMYMLAGWRQWADAGMVSSGLPEYLVQITGARQIGKINPDGFYLFQVPGTHDLLRPVVNFKDGFPVSLNPQKNEFYYTGDDEHGLIIFIGDEPHMDIERYTQAVLDAAEAFNVKRIVGVGGVYGELPYDKERIISCVYSLSSMKEEINHFSVTLSDYHGGASIESYLCRRAGDRNQEFLAFYAFVPFYNFSEAGENGSSIQVENDFTAWLGVMQRVKHMLKLKLDLNDLEKNSRELIELIDKKVDEIDRDQPQLGLRDYLNRLSEAFQENTFNPLDDIWEDELNRLLNKMDSDEEDDQST